MNYIYTAMLLISLICGFLSGTGHKLGAALMEGAKAGMTLSLSLSGPLLLWSGLGKLMDQAGITDGISRIFYPFLKRIFPDIRKDPELKKDLCFNFCANLLGLGNAATPPGIRAALRLKQGNCAGDQLCRLVVLNTASIQLIPTSVAAIRSGLGCKTPFDILPAVWITSLFSAFLGLTAAYCMGKVLKHD